MVETVFRVMMIGVIISIVVGIIGTVACQWSIDTSPYLQGLASFLSVVYYILPIGKLAPIITVTITLMNLRIVISLIKTIWSLIPIHG